MNLTHLFFCFFFALSFSVIANDDVVQDDDVAQLENKISLLKSEPESSDNQTLIDTYEQTIVFLNESKLHSDRAKRYQTLMDNFPQQSAQLQQQIKQYQSTPFPDTNQWSKKALEEELALRTSQLLALQQTKEDKKRLVNEIEKQVSGFQQTIDKLRSELVSLQHKLDIQSFDTDSDKVSQAKLVLTQVNESALSNQILALELEQISAGNRYEIYRLNIDLLDKQIIDLQNFIYHLQQDVNARLKQAAESAIARGERLAQQSVSSSPLFNQLLKDNQIYSDNLNALTKQLDESLEVQSSVDRQMDEINTAVDNIREQVEWLKVSSAFGEHLRTRLSQLPKAPPLEATEQNIVSTRLAKYDYQQALEGLNNISVAQKRYIKEADHTFSVAEQQEIRALLETRKQLLTQLLTLSENYIYEQAKLKVSYSQMTAKIDQIQDIANQYLFWIPNTKAISTNLFSDTLVATSWLLSQSNTQQIPLAIKDKIHTDGIAYAIGFIVLIYCWIFSNRNFRHYLKNTAERVGKVTQDKISYTFNNVLVSILLALPVPALLFSLAHLLLTSWKYPFAQNLGSALINVSLGLWLFLIIKNLARPHGLFIAHFKWQEQLVLQQYRKFRAMVMLALPAFGIYSFASHYEGEPIYNSLGLFAFITLNCALAMFYWHVYVAKLPLTYRNTNRKNPHILHHVVMPLLIVVNILNCVMALSGYFYTANALLNQFQFSVFIMMLFVLTYYLIHRWMFIQKRRLAFERAKARRAEILAQREKEEEEPETRVEQFDNIEEPEIDLDTISAQSLGLLRTLLYLSYALLMIYLWAQVYSAFSFLDSVTVWNSSSSLNGKDIIDPVTLQDLIFAIFSLWTMFVVVKNLSGALELLILQHIDFAPGTGFAITTIAKYLVIIIGVTVGCSFMGIDWSKTQWLAAALTVGLGFGLQEIFANIVSGLMILFEKPIRIGDTVTIRDLTGTVSKIKTRATTLVDFDRKEIIVPNKAFITEQFINWELSDPIVRVIIHVGVTFDSDPVTVTNTLFKAMGSCSLVLETPQPQAYFVGYSNGIKQFECRVFVNDSDNLMPIKHEVYSAIDKTFKEANIIINNPQLDINIKRASKISHTR
ncbi:miniconductance mechanosensitive channel MscM [Motilimonas eburnea]|uniref:miniconductance mechanosensitive channel MscM n=1 Tax=Motilimonas eburnea TaxID=1737488 RepID=UPI001E528235|nr:miniconductance mechanosensitive channel MscM [Motilimonas eburnea]MCE2570589.1 miniconductance mechanosensitive channel MscM [Motilimonas eburnea]